MKLIKALLEVKFPDINVDALLEIVSATPNPELSTEILCGLYEPPILFEKVVSNKSIELTLSYYDKWNDEVHYSYQKEKTINGYFPKDTIKEEITFENFKEREQTWKPNTEQINITIKTGETVIDKSYCSSKTWLEYTPL
jgi:hypothetical protein